MPAQSFIENWSSLSSFCYLSNFAVAIYIVLIWKNSEASFRGRFADPVV